MQSYKSGALFETIYLGDTDSKRGKSLIVERIGVIHAGELLGWTQLNPTARFECVISGQSYLLYVGKGKEFTKDENGGMGQHGGDLSSESLSFHLSKGLDKASQVVTICDLRDRHGLLCCQKRRRFGGN